MSSSEVVPHVSPVVSSPVSPETRLLRIQQAATYLGCTVWYVRSLIWERKIPFVKLGKRQLIDKGDLDVFITQQKRRAVQ